MEASKALIRAALDPFALAAKALRRTRMLLYRSRFRRCGQRVVFDPADHFSYETISLGDDVFIGGGAWFSATDSAITIGSQVLFGPRVMIMGGDHPIDAVGRRIAEVREKQPTDDQPVTIEDDVWVGAGAIILKGVTIATGSVIGAGSIVTRSVPEFSIAVGAPARVVRSRFGPDQLAEHRRLLALRPLRSAGPSPERA